MLYSIRKFLKVFLFVELGACVGRILHILVRYKTNPGYYKILPVPFYVHFIPVCITTAIIVAVTAILYWVLSRVIRKKETEKKGEGGFY